MHNKCLTCNNDARLYNSYCGRCQADVDAAQEKCDAWEAAEQAIAATQGYFNEGQSECLRDMLRHLRSALS
jgi:hypothetical protein